MKTLFQNATVLDGTRDMTPQAHTDVLVENGRIVSVGPCDGEGAQVVDLKNKYLMPGLCNLHVHLPAGGRPGKQRDQKKLAQLVLRNPIVKQIAKSICASYARDELFSGVTTLRAVGGLSDIDTDLRDRIDSGRQIGPRILAANMAIGPVGGHMVGTVAEAAETEAQAVAMVRARAAQKVDLIKLMVTGGVLDATVRGEPGVLKMPPDLIRACCDEAHKHGLRVAAHVQSAEGVRAAVANGVDTIEHGAILDDAAIHTLKEKGGAVVCTISPAFPLAKFDRAILGVSEEVQYNSGVVLNGMIEGAKQALAAGIPVGLGTDTGCPYTTHYNMWRELVFFQKFVGVSPAFALYTATLLNAQLVGLETETGSIEAGKSADFLITDSDPLAGFETVKEPYMVVMRGKVFRQPKAKKYKQTDDLLDRYMP